MRGLLSSTLLLIALAAGAGTEWSVYSDPSELGSLSLTGQALWGAGRGGALRLDLQSGEITYLRTDDGLPINDLGAVLALSEEEIWLGTLGEGLLRYRPAEADPWKRFQVLPQGLAGDEVLCLAVDAGGSVWYGTSRGLGVMEGDSPGQIWTNWEGLDDEQVQSLAFAGETLYVGTSTGLYSLTPEGEIGFESAAPTTSIEQIVATGEHLFLLSEDHVHWRSLGGLDWSMLALPVASVTPTALATVEGRLLAVLRRAAQPPKVWSYDPDGESWEDHSAGAPDPGWSPDYSSPRFETLAAASTGQFYLGGEIYMGFGPGLWESVDGEWTVHLLDQGPMGPETKALGFGPTGRLWTNSNVGAASQENDGTWTRYRKHQDLVNWPAWSIDVMEDRQGWVWFCNFTYFFARMRVSDGLIEAVPIGPEGASSDHIVRMAEDAAGRRWFVTDDAGFCVLDENDLWHQFNTSHDSVPGDVLDDLAFLGPNRLALLFRGVGLQVWDHGGTLDSFGDDHWWRLDSGIEDEDGDLITDTTGAALAASPSGEIWVGQADGLVYLKKFGDDYTVFDHLGKKSPYGPGLLHARVNDLALDPSGGVWAVTEGGLSKVFFDEDEGWRIDSWTSEAGREEAGADLFGPEVLSPLPEASLVRVALSPDGERILVGTRSSGLVKLQLTADPETPPEALDGAYLYPNPLRADLGHRAAYCGGIDFAIDAEIYNVEGQLVWQIDGALPGEPFWPGLNTRFGNRAASGIYLVQLTYRGRSARRELVLLR